MAKLSELDDRGVIELYVHLRDKRAQRKAEYTDADSSDKGKQEKIEIEFLRRFQDRGVDSVSARDVGTAYRSTRVSATVGDWDSFLGHVKENGAWEMLERRANKTAVEQFKTVEGDLPPGINWSETQTVNFRRK